MPKAVTSKAQANVLMCTDRMHEILSRDWMTRFTYSDGPLCRWPGATVDQVKRWVLDDLSVLHNAIGHKPSDGNALRIGAPCIGVAD